MKECRFEDPVGTATDKLKFAVQKLTEAGFDLFQPMTCEYIDLEDFQKPTIVVFRQGEKK